VRITSLELPKVLADQAAAARLRTGATFSLETLRYS
jgi:hypothetical protein